MHWYDGILEIAMHNEIRIRRPDAVMMMQSIQEVVMRLIAILQSRIVPLLVKQKFHLVFLQTIVSIRNICFLQLSSDSPNCFHRAMLSSGAARSRSPSECLVKGVQYTQ